MKKSDIPVLGQLLSGMKDALAKIENAQKRKDEEQLVLAKKEMILFQKKIEDILG